MEVSYSLRTNTSFVTGYCIDVFDALVKNLPYPVAYQYVPSTIYSSYEELLSLVFEKVSADMINILNMAIRKFEVISVNNNWQ